MKENRNKYFVQQFLQEEYKHGGVGGTDAEKVLLSLGYSPIAFPHHHSFSFGAKVGRLIFLLKLLLTLPKNSTVVFLFPVYASAIKFLLKILSKKKSVKCICFIMDINGLKDGDEKVLEEEIEFLNRFNFFIVHNESMQRWLNEHVKKDTVSANVEFFDFPANSSGQTRKPSPEIVFAGNLEKSGFLKNLPLLATSQPTLKFNLYGPGMFSIDESFTNVRHLGIFPPHELPEKLVGSFGLVWDGDSVEQPSASLGHYMQYITHHKVSLYILSGLPIIIAASAGAAPLVLKYGIGVTVNSLFDIESAINKITEDDYKKMRENMKPIAERISSGAGLSKALADLE